MRTALILSGLVIALLSCNKKPEKEFKNPWCTLKCQDPQIKVRLPFSGDTLKNMALITYTNNGAMNDTVSVSYPATVYLSPGYDYQLLLPKVNRSFVFTYINSHESERQGKCGDVCANAVSVISVQFGWQPYTYFSMELTGPLEYTLNL